jgi:hypothetical protein
LRSLSLAGDLTIGTVPNFVRFLDNVTFDAGIFWRKSSMTLNETTIKKLQITCASGQLQYLLDLKAVDELSILDPIDLGLLLSHSQHSSVSQRRKISGLGCLFASCDVPNGSSTKSSPTRRHDKQRTGSTRFRNSEIPH